MLRQIFIFLGTFAAGALIALVARAALFQPHAEHQGHPAPGGDYAPMVTNPLAPAAPASAKPDPAPAGMTDHSQHGTSGESADAGAAGKPVNTICAICGMDVNPAIPTAEYQGKTIGFGCKMCPPKFKADPDRYGPAYLRNEIIKR